LALKIVVGAREQGTGNREQGTGNRERVLGDFTKEGNREQGANKKHSFAPV
jgi:hypothetical protein